MAPEGVAQARGLRRRDTRLEAEGAEFLVLGLLLAEGIQAFKSYARYPGYDVIAVNPQEDRSCRIQVKSRYSTGAMGFPIKNFECDFVTYVKLNRAYSRPRKADSGRRSPELWVFPVEVVQAAWKPGGGWGGVVRLRDIYDVDGYKDNWGQVRRFLSRP